jgi:hypothetical protein
MRTHIVNPSDARALVTSSIWLRVGLIGATAVAAGILQLLEGDLAWLSPLALAFCGGVLAAVSWSRARAVLDSGHPSVARRPPSVALGSPRSSAGTAAE